MARKQIPEGEGKNRGWLTLVYPTEEYIRKNYPDCEYDGKQGWGNAPDNWKEMLAQVGCMALISPLHCYDINEDAEGGPEPKKPHYHVILLWETGTTTYKNARHYVDMINGVGCKAMANLRGSARYHCHLDNPEKYQYNPEDETVIGGMDYMNIITSQSENQLIAIEIMEFCKKEKLWSFNQLMDYCICNRMDWARAILSGQRENIFRYQRALQYDLEQQARAADLALRPKVPEDLRHALEIENAKRLLAKEGLL